MISQSSTLLANFVKRTALKYWSWCLFVCLLFCFVFLIKFWTSNGWNETWLSFRLALKNHFQTDVLLSYHPIYVGNLCSLVSHLPIKMSLFVISAHITTYQAVSFTEAESGLRLYRLAAVSHGMSISLSPAFILVEAMGLDQHLESS